MTTATKSAVETAAEIRSALDEKKTRALGLARDLDAALEDQVRSGTLGAGASSRVGQLARKLDETERSIVELERQAEVAGRLASEEAAIALRARVDAIKSEADKQRARETEAWGKSAEAFSTFVATVSAHAQLVQQGLEVRAELRREFANQPELDELIRIVCPAVSPTPSDLPQAVALLSAQVGTAGTSIQLPQELESARRTPEPAFGAILKESEAPPWGFVRSGSNS